MAVSRRDAFLWTCFVISVGAPLWLDLVIDLDGLLPWVLVLAIAASSAALVLDTIRDGRRKEQAMAALEGANESLRGQVRMQAQTLDSSNAFLKEAYDRIKELEKKARSDGGGAQ